MNARSVVARLLEIMRRCDPAALRAGEEQTSDREWDAVVRSASSYLVASAETDNIVPEKPSANRAWGALSACPCCGSPAEMQKRISAEAVPAFVVCCNRSATIAPEDDPEIGEGCVLDLPPFGFYHGTAREAAKYWNQYAAALTRLRATAGQQS